MKKILKITAFVVAIFGMFFGINGAVFADEDTPEEDADPAMSVSISPVSKILNLEPNSTYDDSFKVTNNSKQPMKFEVHASPYSYTFSEENNAYMLGFSSENNYTQIVRWITFADKDGKYVKNTEFVAEPEGTVEVKYRISTPSSIPNGGQYAVLFAHALADDTEGSGVKTEASPGLVIYGRSTGETKIEGSVKESDIYQTLEVEGKSYNIVNGAAKVANTGNVDFMAQGILKVTGLFGRTYYETPESQGRISIIPETELTVSDVWEDTPFFGIFKATWTVIAAGNTEEPITKLVVIMPPVVIILIILLLTILIIWIIIMVRKRKERRSRFTV